MSDFNDLDYDKLKRAKRFDNNKKHKDRNKPVKKQKYKADKFNSQVAIRTAMQQIEDDWHDSIDDGYLDDMYEEMSEEDFKQYVEDMNRIKNK